MLGGREERFLVGTEEVEQVRHDGGVSNLCIHLLFTVWCLP